MDTEDERRKWEHNFIKIGMVVCAGMMILCALVVYHIFAR